MKKTISTLSIIFLFFHIVYSQNLELHVKYYDPFIKTQLMEKYYTIAGTNKVHGEYKNWASNGKLTTFTNYTNGVYNGLSKTFDKYSGKIESEILYKDGKIITEKYYIKNTYILVERNKGFTVYENGIITEALKLKKGTEYKYTSAEAGELSWGANEYEIKNSAEIKNDIASEIILNYPNGKPGTQNLFRVDGFSYLFISYDEKGNITQKRELIDEKEMKYKIDYFENGVFRESEFYTYKE